MFCSLAVAVLSACGITRTQANDIEPTKEFYTATKLPNPVTLDGLLTEWTGVPVLSDPKFWIAAGGEGTPAGKGKGGVGAGSYVLFERYQGGDWTGPDDQTSAVQVGWDADNVYFGFIVTDEYHENSQNSAWNGDSVQLMIADATRTSQIALYNYALGGVEEDLAGMTPEDQKANVIIMHEAGPGGTDAVVTRDTVKKKTYYEITLPASSLGMTAPLAAGTKFGLGMAINDGDKATPGQKGWGGLGAHSIVFNKTPQETALITLGAQGPGTEVFFLSAIKPSTGGKNPFTFRATDKGASVVDPASAKLTIDGSTVALVAGTKNVDATDFSSSPSFLFPFDSTHTYLIEVKDTKGQLVSDSGSFTTGPAPLPVTDKFAIGLNFGADNPDAARSSLNPDEEAGAPGARQALWNNIPGASGSQTDIVAYKQGASVATSVTVDWTSNNLWASSGDGEENNGFPVGSADRKLFSGYLDTGGATTTTVSITGIPTDLTGTGYDVYIYMLGGVGLNRGGGYRVLDSDGGTVLATYKIGDGVANPNSYIQDAGMDHRDAGDYLVFHGLSSATLFIEATTDHGLGNTRAPINAVQLVSSAKATTPAPVLSRGGLRADVFLDEAGASPIDTLTSDPRYPSNPDFTRFWNVFGPYSSGNNYGENLGVLVTGWIIPPLDGDYKFYLRSDDAGQLWLSTDETEANDALIAEQTGCCNAFTDAEGTLSSLPITLKAGQRYHVKGLLKEGGGDDYIQVGWRTPASASLNTPPTGPIPGKFLQTMVDPTASLVITQNPADVTLQANQSLTLSVRYTASSAFGNSANVQWQKSTGGGAFTDIPGATSQDYTIPFAALTDAGKYHAVVSIGDLATKTSTDATVTVTADTTPPTVVSATPGADNASVTLVFSEPVDAATATAAGNITINGLAVNNVTVNGTTVQLSTAAQAEGAPYTITLKGIKDTAGNLMNPNPSTFDFHARGLALGFVEHRFWNNITPNAISSLTGDPRFPNNPDLVTYEPLFEYGPNGSNESGSNYGNMLQGELIPPVTGDYVFFCSGDDPVQVWLSTDADPANKKLIAIEPQWNNARQWLVPDRRDTDNPQNRSDKFMGTEWPTLDADGHAVITLTAGNHYYIQALHTEGGGGDSVGVAWRTPLDSADPDNGTPPISGAFIGSSIIPTGTVTITQNPTDQSVPANSTATFTGAATSSDTPLFLVWERAPKNGNFVPVGTGASYTTPVLSLSDDGARYRLVASTTKGVASSSEATLTVTVDKTPPTVVGAKGNFTFNGGVVTFSEGITPASAGDINNYSIDGLAISGVTVLSPTTVKLDTAAQTVGSVYKLTVKNFVDMAGNKTATQTVDLLAFVRARGYVEHRKFENVTPNAIASLTSDPRYPDAPDLVTYEHNFEYGPDTANLNESGSNYGNFLQGWLVVPVTGDYVFYVSGDDFCELYLSTDADPANKKLIATEPQWNNARQWLVSDRRTAGSEENRSDRFATTEWPTGNTIHLEKGSKHYIQVLHSEGGGGDSVGVAWKLSTQADPPNGSPPIRGEYVESIVDPTLPKALNSDDVTFFIEAEDFNFDGGQTLDAASAMPYRGGAFDGKGAIANVDYNHNDGDSDLYRTGETPNVPMDNNTARDGFRGNMDIDISYKIGWIGPDRWFNYTRTIPQGEYAVYAAQSFDGGTPPPPHLLKGRLSMVDDVTTATQNLTDIGTFDAPGTAGWGVNRLIPMTDANGAPHTVNLSGKVNLRYTAVSGDFDYLLFAKVGPGSVVVPPPHITITRDATTGKITVSWTNGGKLQAAPSVLGPWQDVTPTSPYVFTPDPQVPFLFGRVVRAQ